MDFLAGRTLFTDLLADAEAVDPGDPAATIAASALVVGGVSSVGPTFASGTTTVYASPTGSGTACTQTGPCSITQAQTTVRGLTASMTGAFFCHCLHAPLR